MANAAKRGTKFTHHHGSAYEPQSPIWSMFDASEMFDPNANKGPMKFYARAHALAEKGLWQESIMIIEPLWNPKGATPYLVLLRAVQYCKVAMAKECLETLDLLNDRGVPLWLVCHIKAILSFEMYNDGNRDTIYDAINFIKKACMHNQDNAGIHVEATTIILTGHYADNDESHARGEGHNAMDAALPEEAIQLGKRAIQLGSTEPLLYLNLGNAHLNTRHTKDAVEYFKKALELDPFFGEAKLMLGTALFRIMLDSSASNVKCTDGDYQKVIDLIDESMELDGPSELALTTKADIQISRDDMKGLRKTLARLKRYEPSSLPDVIWRIEMHIIADDIKGAKKYILQATDLDPSMRFMDEIKDTLNLSDV